MGSSIQQSHFTDEDHAQFASRLQQNLSQLSILLHQPGFGLGKFSLGAELELSLINPQGKAKWINQKILELANDPQLTLELNQYNLEYNLSPLAAAGSPFSIIAQEITAKLAWLNRIAEPLATRTVAIGILPTLEQKDISQAAMSDFVRYRVLTETIKGMHEGPFEINIKGADPLFLTLPNLNAEGANTSFQIHLRVNPKEFADCYNAAQMATALGLAISTNSPLFLGHRLWEETRIPLFKQAVETRKSCEIVEHRTARTGLGSGWVKASAFELFQRSVDDFEVLLPELGTEEKLTANTSPTLFELRLHHGTIWHWNRAIYDPASGGHLRIELRALPSGPSPIDMAASGAFLVGLTKALSHRMKEYTALIDFNRVKTNFYRAAELGLDAPLLWPGKNHQLKTSSAQRLIQQLIPLAQQGLEELEVDPKEIDLMLGIIQQRLDKRITGARWQLKTLQHYEQKMKRDEALTAMLNCYLTQAYSGKPVHQWSMQ
ncbi:MAG: hypothetical protein K9K86_06445 [Pseudomonadales bacterium]|nr:hypothetical protein [Pseudomonadales bacterium]